MFSSISLHGSLKKAFLSLLAILWNSAFRCLYLSFLLCFSLLFFSQLFVSLPRHQRWPQDWKRSVFIPIPKKGNVKKCLNYRTIALMSHTSKNNAQNSPSQASTVHELPDVQAGFRKGRGIEDQIANIQWIIKKAESSRKTFTSALLTMPKSLIVWLTTNSGKLVKRWEYQTVLSAS